MKEKDFTEYRICKDTKISRSRFSDWRYGIRLPLPDNLTKLDSYFDCSLDYLVGHED